MAFHDRFGVLVIPRNCIARIWAEIVSRHLLRQSIPRIAGLVIAERRKRDGQNVYGSETPTLNCDRGGHGDSCQRQKGKRGTGQISWIETSTGCPATRGGADRLNCSLATYLPERFATGAVPAKQWRFCVWPPEAFSIVAELAANPGIDI